MTNDELFIKAEDGKELFTRRWIPDQEPTAVLLIVHGLGEHSGRYHDFATFLAQRQVAVYSYDHRGHGLTDPDQKGHIDKSDGFTTMVQDLKLMHSKLHRKFSDLPLFIFGHSMGSFITMNYLQTQEDSSVPAGVIYSGTSGAVSSLLPFGVMLSGFLKKVAGDRHRSEFMRNIVFKPYNNAFKPVRTEHDWISSDPEAVDRYIRDPHCGFIPTTSFLHDFFRGLQQTQNASPFSGPHTYPVLIVAGSEDPISKPLDGIQKLKEKLTESGISSPDTLIYQGGRHEMLSETNRHQVMEDISNWITGKI